MLQQGQKVIKIGYCRVLQGVQDVIIHTYLQSVIGGTVFDKFEYCRDLREGQQLIIIILIFQSVTGRREGDNKLDIAEYYRRGMCDNILASSECYRKERI